MPRHCSVYGCQSNYDGRGSVSTFSLPKNAPLKAQWLSKIPTDFSTLKNPIVCVKHFNDNDVIWSDTIIVNGEMKTFPRQVPKLKEGAVPSLFAGAPAYLSEKHPKSRCLIDAENENLECAIKNSLITRKEDLERNKIASLDDIQHYLKARTVTNSYIILKKDKQLILCLFEVSSDVPVITGNITINENLEFSVFVDKTNIGKFPFLRPGKVAKLDSFDIFEDLLTFFEDLVDKKLNRVLNECKVHFAIELLEQNPTLMESQNLQFVVEQLKLFLVNKNNARYENRTMLFASTLFVHSPSAYEALRKCGFLFLPHPRNLKKLVCNFSITDNSIDGSISYLKMHLNNLQKHELLVCINIGEIYIQPRMCFKGGSVFGSSVLEPEKIAKTAQVFMISSVFSKYRDVICIVPVLNLTGVQLHSRLLNVIKEIESIGFQVLAIISDNNPVNRNAFKQFNDGKNLLSQIKHPFSPSRQLFFIFDTVHILKCIRNNWHCKKLISFTDIDNGEIICNAQYKHLENLYDIEKNSLVKFGNLPSYKVLYPSTIQKQNVKLALKLINEKNSVALKHVSETNKDLFNGVNETIKFMEIFINWWKIVNVKSVYEKERFNDVFREAIKPDQNFQIEFLEKMCTWLKKWQLSVPSGKALSPQTFLSLITTTEAFLGLIPYVFKMYGTNYILLSKFQNDCLESRFSTYRQLSVSNYYISYTELLENEKKVRFRNAVILSSGKVCVPLRTLTPSTENHCDVNVQEFSAITEESFNFESVPKNIIPVLVFIAGFTTFRVLKESNCELCRNWLEGNKELDMKDKMNDFTLDLNRGKLKIPKTCVVVSVNNVWYVLNEIFEKFLPSFLKTSHQLSLLNKISLIFLHRESENIPFKETCLYNRTLLSKLEYITLIASKIFINNLVKSLNDKNKIDENDRRKKKKLVF